MNTPHDWYRDNFVVSTNKSLLQPRAINAALGSDLLWWAKALPEDQLQTMLDNTFCFGLYVLPNSTADIAGKASPTQIGLARLVTDYVTFAYLTDVYVLPDYQGKGLGSWMIGCISETMETWTALRGLVLITSPAEAPWYNKLLGANTLDSVKGREVNVMVKNGAGR